MDLNDISYDKLKSIYNKYFSLGNINLDINSKFALIGLTCYITDKLKKKNPDWSHWRTLYEINKGTVPENFIKGLAIKCEDYAYRCTEFPNFGIEDKKIPSKIKELLNSYIPF